MVGAVGANGGPGAAYVFAEPGVVARPVVKRISFSAGPLKGGTMVTITGLYLGAFTPPR